MELPGKVTTVLGYLRYGLDKFREIVLWIAGFIAKFVDFPAENIYNILIIVISLWLAYKIFHVRNVTIQGRWLEYGIIAVIVYVILKLI